MTVNYPGILQSTTLPENTFLREDHFERRKIKNLSCLFQLQRGKHSCQLQLWAQWSFSEANKRGAGKKTGTLTCFLPGSASSAREVEPGTSHGANTRDACVGHRTAFSFRSRYERGVLFHLEFMPLRITEEKLLKYSWWDHGEWGWAERDPTQVFSPVVRDLKAMIFSFPQNRSSQFWSTDLNVRNSILST